MTDATDPSSAPSSLPTRWWLARPGMKPLGPYAWPDLIATVRRAGGVSDWMACPEGGTEWKPLASDPAIVAAVNPPPMPPPPGSPTPPSLSEQGFPPPDYRPGYPAAVVPNSGLLVLLHLSVLAYFVIPLLGLVIPLALWLSNRDKPDVDAHGKEVMNWIIFTVIAAVVSAALVCLYIGVVLLAILFVVVIVYAILGAVKASNGELIRYPMFFRLIK